MARRARIVAGHGLGAVGELRLEAGEDAAQPPAADLLLELGDGIAQRAGTEAPVVPVDDVMEDLVEDPDRAELAGGDRRRARRLTKGTRLVHPGGEPARTGEIGDEDAAPKTEQCLAEAVLPAGRQ